MPIQPEKCPACGTPTTATGRYCAQCGAALSRGSPPVRERRAWHLAAVGSGLVLVLLLVLILRDRSSAAAAAPATTPANVEAPPDLGAMSPRERFDRLYRRVMSAAQTGDTVTTARFAPMAFAAYAQLDSVDADARYHAALLHLHLQGDTASALRLADSILTSVPRHLFGFLIQGTAAQLSGNARLLERSRRDFLAAWELELQAKRPEYEEHRRMLEQFRTTALAAQSSPPGG